MNSIAKLQGTPWHYEQARKTCQDGSKYCVYNHNICSNKYCKNYHKKCLGKSRCELFEPKTGTPKIYSERTYIDKDKQIKANPNKIHDSLAFYCSPFNPLTARRNPCMNLIFLESHYQSFP